MKHENTAEFKNQIAIKIIRGHLKLMRKHIDFCLERLEQLERVIASEEIKSSD